MIRIGAVQHPSTESLLENFEYISNYTINAKEAGCSCVCFPECSLTGYFPEKSMELSISPDDPIIAELSSLAKHMEIDILVGFMEAGKTSYYVTHGIFRPNGSTDFYRKSHLGKKEQLYFSEGQELPVFSLTCNLQIGFQLCVETHFPDITQTLALRGAEVIFSPHAVPRISGNREHIWNKYIPARSYDNRIYMICCNQWDEKRFGGGCLVTDPRGEIVSYTYKDNATLLTANIDRELIIRYRTEGDKRSTHYYPSKRRSELYE